MNRGACQSSWARRRIVSLIGMVAAFAFSSADALAGPAPQPLAAVDYRPATPEAPAMVVLSLTTRPDFKAFALEGPSRLVVDLLATRPADRLELSRVASIAAPAPLRGLRIAQRGETLRVVLDLAGPVDNSVRWRPRRGANRPALEVLLGKPLPAVLPPPAVAAASPVPVLTPEPLPPSLPPPLSQPLPAPMPVPSPRAPVQGRELVIAIDAGHGGKDPGAVGARGTREKDVTLAVAKRLAATIDAEPGLRAYLVRDGDYFIELRQRMVRARKAGADLFVSIHADSAPNRAAAGSSVFILSTRGASSEAARWLADRENAADLAGGVQLDKVDPTVASVLMDLSQGDTITSSDRAARRVLEELDRIGNIHKREVQSAGFVVLKSPDIPSMLVETAFISHPAEEDRLGDPDHQQRLAQAIRDGLRAYFAANPPPGTRNSARTRGSGTPARIAAVVR